MGLFGLIGEIIRIPIKIADSTLKAVDDVVEEIKK